MSSQSTSTTSSGSEKDKGSGDCKSEDKKKKTKLFCSSSESTSHTKFLRKPRHEDEFKLITRDEYYLKSPTISSADTFGCLHGPEGIQYDTETFLKRQFLKELDPLTVPRKWNVECPPSYGWEITDKIVFLIEDTDVLDQLERFQRYLREFARISNRGFRIDSLDNLVKIMDFLLWKFEHLPALKENFVELLTNIGKPMLLIVTSDVVKYFDTIRTYIGFMGYLLLIINEQYIFDIISKAIIFHLSAPDSERGPDTVHLRHSIAAGKILIETTVRMLAIANSHKFATFLEIALLLACDTEENCIDMMKENIIENILYRFNPYFPQIDLPHHDINPADCYDINVKLGDSSVHMSKTLSLLLVLLKSTMKFLEQSPQHHLFLPCPDTYSIRCFHWVYRYECRSRNHYHERTTLTVIAAILLKIFGHRLTGLTELMSDVMTLSVMTEIPPRDDWTRTVNFNATQQDVHFKKVLIYFSVNLLKALPCNRFLVTSRHWLLGLMYLIDPGLGQLRMDWSTALFTEIRKTALQALVSILPLCDPKLVKEYDFIRRIMWYIEWYTSFPYQISTLYWCVRVLQTAVYHRENIVRNTSIQDLFDTHGIIILMHLCATIIKQKRPPLEKSQAVLSVCLRILTSSANASNPRRVSCMVYPTIIWPVGVNELARNMLHDVMYCLEQNYILSDRWLISLLNFIWETVIWRKEYRESFVRKNGVYSLLDMVAMTRPTVQCVALALICDIVRTGNAVGHLVTWRASRGASNAIPFVVKRGSTIAALLASVIRNECELEGIKISAKGVLEHMEHPILGTLESGAINALDLSIFSQHCRVCIPAGSMAGSRMSKAFAILHLLSEDLAFKVQLTDEHYNLYKNIPLTMEDETIFVLCSHYLTLKLNEVWMETKLESPKLEHVDEVILDEFINIGKGWVKAIKLQQEDVVARHETKDRDQENSLYSFLGRIRLNIALDALKTVRCSARSADRHRLTHAMLHDAVYGHHRRSLHVKKIDAPVLRTYTAPLDYDNMTGQNVKVSQSQKNPDLKQYLSSSSGSFVSECNRPE